MKLATMLAAGCLITPRLIGPVNAGCPNFASYARAPMAKIDGDKWLEDAIKPVIKIDRRLTPGDLEAVFNCVLTRNLPKIRQIFGGGSITVDSHLYQFPASEFAYGRVLVNTSSYGNFIQGHVSQPTIVMKVNFDFNKDGQVVDQDLFVIKAGADKLVYGEFISDKFVETTRCFKCHDKTRNAGMFFKSRYNGLRTIGKARLLALP